MVMATQGFRLANLRASSKLFKELLHGTLYSRALPRGHLVLPKGRLLERPAAPLLARFAHDLREVDFLLYKFALGYVTAFVMTVEKIGLIWYQFTAGT